MNKVHINKDDTFYILRFVSFGASHDVGEKGISLEMKRNLIKELQQYGKVFITNEGNLEPEFDQYRLRIEPHEIQDLMYYATMVIGDSQTMIAESAVLGTPAIRCNTFVGRLSYLEELEHKYELTYGFLPKN